MPAALELLRPRIYLDSLRPLGLWTLLVAPVGARPAVGPTTNPWGRQRLGFF